MGNSHASSIAPVRLASVPSGSILLVRQETQTAFGRLDPSIIRGVASAQRGGGIYSMRQQSLSTWTHCAIILERKGKHYVAQATAAGILLAPAAKYVMKLQAAGARVAVRRLTGPMTEDMNALLVALLHAAAAGCDWESYMPEVTSADLSAASGPLPTVLLPGQLMRLPKASDKISHGPEADSKPSQVPDLDSLGGPSSSPLSTRGSDESRDAELKVNPRATASSTRRADELKRHSHGGSSTRSADLSPFARDLIRLLIPRVYAALQALPPRHAVELSRAFAVVDTNGDGRCVGEEHAVFFLIPGAHPSGYTSMTLGVFSVRCGVRLYHPKSCGYLLQQWIHRGACTLGSVVNRQSSYDLSPLCSPDAVNISHFQSAFACQPLRDIPLEHDLDSILCGEFVACMFELLGLLPRRSTAVHGPDSETGGRSRSNSSSVVTEALAASYVRGGSGHSVSPVGGPSVRRGSTDTGSQGRPPRGPIHSPVEHPHAGLPSSLNSPSVSKRDPAAAGKKPSRGTLVLVDSVMSDFKHFTPMSFSTLHRPRLQLIRGHLESEELLDLALDVREGDGVAQPGPSNSSAAAVLALTEGTALSEQSARTATSLAAAGPQTTHTTPLRRNELSARAPHMEEALLPIPPPRVGWLPSLRVSVAGDSAEPPPLPTVSVLTRERAMAPRAPPTQEATPSVAIDMTLGRVDRGSFREPAPA